MEFNCASCKRRLRIPDGLGNPRVRCPNCKHVARPLPLSRPRPASRAATAANQPRPATQTRPVPTRRTPPAQQKSNNWGGCIGILLFGGMFLAGQLPELIENLKPKPPRQPPAAEQREDLPEMDPLPEVWPPDDDEPDPAEAEDADRDEKRPLRRLR